MVGEGITPSADHTGVYRHELHPFSLACLSRLAASGAQATPAQALFAAAPTRGATPDGFPVARPVHPLRTLEDQSRFQRGCLPARESKSSGSTCDPAPA